jgi:hypothetical protein
MSGASIATQCWVYYIAVSVVGMFSVSLDPENRKTEKIMRFTIPKTNC